MFEVDFQKPNKKIEGGTLWSISTLILNTQAFNPLRQIYPKQPDTKRGEVQFQLHQPTEFAHMSLDSNYKKYTKSLTLKPGYEYEIDIFPNGQMSTQGFKDLTFQQRGCHLKNEVSELSLFKIYTKKNCR